MFNIIRKKRNQNKEHFSLVDKEVIDINNIIQRRYDCLDTKWKPINSTMSVGRGGCAAVAVTINKNNNNNNNQQQQQIIVFGGNYPIGTNVVELYNLKEQKWKLLRRMPMKLSYCAAVNLDNDNLFVLGGNKGIFPRAQDCFFKYNITRNEWKRLASMKQKRAYLAIVVVKNKIYGIGGYNAYDDSLDTVEVFDTTNSNSNSNDWIILPAKMNKKRCGCCAVTINGIIYVIAGEDENNNLLNTIEMYDTSLPESKWALIPGATIKTKREGAAAVALGCYIFIIGGNDGRNYLNTIEVFNTRTNQFVTNNFNEFSLMTSKRSFCAAVLIGSHNDDNDIKHNKIVVVGGYGDGENSKRTAEMIEIQTNKKQLSSKQSSLLAPSSSAVVVPNDTKNSSSSSSSSSNNVEQVIKYDIGTKIEIYGLINTPQYNNKHGIIIQYNNNNNRRYTIKLSETQQIINVEPTNVRKLKSNVTSTTLPTVSKPPNQNSSNVQNAPVSYGSTANTYASTTTAKKSSSLLPASSSPAAVQNDLINDFSNINYGNSKVSMSSRSMSAQNPTPPSLAQKHEGCQDSAPSPKACPWLWSITYDQLITIHTDLSDKYTADYSNMTMIDVNNVFITPYCETNGTSVALGYNPNGLKVDVFVTHCWHEPFKEFVESIRNVYSANFVKPNLWICAFALHQGDTQLIKDQIGTSLDESPFLLALKRADTFLVVRNRMIDLYNRIWCVFEVMEAMRSGLNPRKTQITVPNTFADITTSVRDAQATKEEDRTNILGVLLSEFKVDEIDDFVQQFRKF